MKIAILTFHAAENYGAVLQAYALQEYLKSTGNQVNIIDYRPEYLINGYRVIPKSSHSGISGIIRTVIRELINFAKMGHYLFLRIKRKKSFNAFSVNYLTLTKETYSKLKKKLEFDIIFFGSDQIWSLQHNCGDTAFLGDVFVDKKTLKIAYAASAGKYSKSLKDYEVFRKNLNNFAAVGVREPTLYDSIKPYFSNRLEVVLDPVLLADEEIWNKFTEKSIINKKYVVVYEVTRNDKLMNLAKNMAKQLDAEIVNIWDGNKMRWNRYTTKTSPCDFVNIVKYASCVVTTSFHAVAFSLIFKKDFYFLSSNNDSEDRVKTILTQLGLLSRFITNINTEFSKINWSECAIDENLKKLKTKSKSFIDYSLNLGKESRI